MKKFIFVFWYVIKRIFSDNVEEVFNLKCNIKVLQFYGMEGLNSPIDYKTLVNESNNNYCKDIDHSCCTREDFSKTNRIWNEKARDLKKYITKHFRIIQKLSVLQSSLLSLANQVREKQTDRCREVEFTFFNSPIKYNEVYFYLENAFEAFAYIQKGFYCMICDSKYQDFLAVVKDKTRMVNVMNHKMCNDLIFFFREFIMFKVYYLDPFFINTNMLFNCMEDTDKYKFNLIYNVTYPNIEACVEKGENCEFVCKEFKFGTTGDLFIGKVDEYHEFLKTIEKLIKMHDPSADILDNTPGSELYIDDVKYPSEFFIDPEQKITEQNYYVLKDFNMTNFETNVEEEGINLFDIAYRSTGYPLTNALTTSVFEKNYGTTNPGQDNESNGGTELDQYKNEDLIPHAFSEETLLKEKEQEEFEMKHEKEKYTEIPHEHLPTGNELSKMQDQLDFDEREADQNLRKKAEQPRDYEGDKLDFGDAAAIKEGVFRLCNQIIISLVIAFFFM
jgi:hypothetical protein